MSTVVIGLGNPVLTDEGVGIHVARAVRAALPPGSDVAVLEVYAGGLRLMDALVGFDRAVIVDALWTGNHEPGTVVQLSMEDLSRTRYTLSVHDLDLQTALDFARACGYPVPSQIDLWGVEIADAGTFSEDLTELVPQDMDDVASRIMTAVGLPQRFSIPEVDA